MSLASSKVQPPKGGNAVMCRARVLLVFLAALLPLMVGQVQAQVAPASSTSGAATSAPATGSSYSSGISGLAGTPSPQGSFLGSVPGKLEPGVVQLSLQDAISRGLRQNLGLLLAGQDVRSSRGERWRQLSALLPNVNTSSYVADSKVDLAEFGFSFQISGRDHPCGCRAFLLYRFACLRDAEYF